MMQILKKWKKVHTSSTKVHAEPLVGSIKGRRWWLS